MIKPIVSLRSVTKTYPPNVQACDEVDLTIQHGEMVAIVGPSGSGKSTLLHMIGTLDRPTSGEVFINNQQINNMSDNEISDLRAHRIGFIFQRFHLSDGVPALDNVAEGLLYQGIPRNVRKKQSAEALERVGLGHRTHHLPNELSGGERQRVAIARAIVADPQLLLADEPTGNLDSVSSENIITILHKLNSEGTSLVVITHNPELAGALPRQIYVKDGRIISDSTSHSTPTVAASSSAPLLV